MCNLTCLALADGGLGFINSFVLALFLIFYCIHLGNIILHFCALQNQDTCTIITWLHSPLKTL